MKTSHILISTVLTLVFVLMVAQTVEAQTLYGTEFQMSPHLWIIDSATGNTLTDVGEIAVVGYTIAGTRGMATDPTDGTLYSILYAAEVVLPANEGHLLVSLNTNNGTGTRIGSDFLTQGLRDLTFDPSGQLYGVSGGPNNSSIPDHLFAIDKTSAVLTDLTVVGTTGTNPRNHSIAYNPNHPGVIYHRYGSIGFETIDIAPPHSFSEIGTNDLGSYTNVSLVFDSDANLFRTAEVVSGGLDPYGWVTIDTAGLRTDTGFDLPVVLNGLAFDQAGTIGGSLFSDGFENGDLLGWDSATE